MRASVVALALLAGGGPASAARLPDWARGIADHAPPVPEGEAPHERRVLLEELRVEVEEDGRLRLRRRVAEQYVRVPTRPAAAQGISVTDSSQVVIARGWHVPWEGRSKRSWGPPIEIGGGGSFVTDARARVVPIGQVAKGSLVFFEFEVRELPWALGYLHVFHTDEAPIDRARLEVATPPGWTVRHAWVGGEAAAEARPAEQVTSWELTGLVPPVVETELAATPIDAAPAIVLSFVPPPGARPEPAFFDDWADLGQWYETIAAGRATAVPAVRAALAEATAGAGESRFELILAASRFVRDGVRYIAKEVGIGALQPRPADQVLANRYGDCKDKATLLQALLAAESVPAYPILVNASRRRSVAESVPAIASMNHVVVGIAIEGAGDAPDWARPAIIDAGEVGRLLVVDPTEEATSPGWLPAYLAGKTALVVAGERSRLVRLPDDLPEANRIERRIEASTAEEEGLADVRLTRVTEYRGWPATLARAAHRRASADWRAAIERGLRARWPAMEILSFEVTPETPDGAFTETVRLRTPLPPGDPPLIAAFPGATDGLERVPLGMREAAVVYPHALELRSEVRWEGPFARVAPQAFDVAGDGWSVSSALEGEGATRHGSWSARLSRTRFDPEEFSELKRFWSSLDLAAGVAIALER
jgi:transglutaminase-like putative cysteine protease